MDAQNWVKNIIRGFMCLTGIIGNNWLGLSSLPKSRSQLRSNDILFINLALSNLITNYMVDLPDIMDLRSNFLAGNRYCGMFNFCSDLSETSSIFSTMFITVFWHQKLVGSLKRGGAPVQMDNVRLVATLLAGSWTVAIVFSIPHFFVVSENIMNKTNDNCMENFQSHEAKQTYEVLYLILANIAPIFGICVASIQITVTLVQSQKRMKGNTIAVSRGGNALDKNGKDVPADAPGLPQSSPEPGSIAEVSKQGKGSYARSSASSRTLLRAATSVVAVASVFLICWLTHLISSILITVRESDLLMEIASYIGAAYTCIIPYIYLHGVKKLHCSCKG